MNLQIARQLDQVAWHLDPDPLEEQLFESVKAHRFEELHQREAQALA